MSMKENVIMNTASRYNFKKLINLDFKKQIIILYHHSFASIQIFILHLQLINYFITHSLQSFTKLISLFEDFMNHFTMIDIILSSLSSSCLLSIELSFLLS